MKCELRCVFVQFNSCAFIWKPRSYALINKHIEPCLAVTRPLRFKVTLFTRCSRSSRRNEEYYASNALLQRAKRRRKSSIKKKKSKDK